jgi:hypothetical protein
MDDDHINLEPYTSNNYVPLVRTLWYYDADSQISWSRTYMIIHI